MRSRTTLLAVALATGLALPAAAPATAAPQPAPTYRAGVVDGMVVATVEDATIVAAPGNDALSVIDSTGAQLLQLPLQYTLDDQRFPIRYQLADDGHAVTLAPGSDARPIASPMEHQLALNDLASNLTVGTLVGTVAGTVLGALVGAAIGLGSCLVVGPGCLATTPAAIAAFAAGGGVLGTVVVGGGLAADGLWKYFTTINSAPGQSPYAGRDGTLDPAGTGVPDANLRLPSGSASGLKAGSSGS
ncbi:hypothetical protein AB0J48_21570 [Nocardia salmonicida]|uniref:hypothetical protein n=1 Tax=Nocardia salmonicida TaxID=53431 RepID=UPI00342CCC59